MPDEKNVEMSKLKNTVVAENETIQAREITSKPIAIPRQKAQAGVQRNTGEEIYTPIAKWAERFRDPQPLNAKPPEPSYENLSLSSWGRPSYTPPKNATGNIITQSTKATTSSVESLFEKQPPTESIRTRPRQTSCLTLALKQATSQQIGGK